MRIGIDCRTILNPVYGEGAGVGHYTYYLVSHILKLERDFDLVLFFDERISHEAVDRLIAGAPRVVARFFPFHEYKHFLPIAYSHLLLTGFINREKLDLYHLPGGLLPLTYRGRSVVTIHDLTIIDHPEWFPPQMLATKLGLPQTIRKARAFIAPSEATKRALMKHFKVEQNQVTVIPHGVEVSSVALTTDETNAGASSSWDDLVARYALTKPYFLFLGTLESRKNISGLMRAFLQAHTIDARMGEVSLVLAGAKGWKSDEIEREIGDAIQGSGGQVRYLGYVPHGDKLPLIANARGFIFPSFDEGFGLPVLEAMSQGTPVITSLAGSLPEVVRDAALLVQPGDPDALASAMVQITIDGALRDRLVVAGRLRARNFSWQKTAEATVAVYQRIVRAT